MNDHAISQPSYKELLAVLEGALEQLEHLTTEQYAQGGDKAVRKLLKAALARSTGDVPENPYVPQTRKSIILRSLYADEPSQDRGETLTLTDADIRKLKDPILKAFARVAFHPGDRITVRLKDREWVAELTALEIED
jgi:hypothetical protein